MKRHLFVATILALGGGCAASAAEGGAGRSTTSVEAVTTRASLQTDEARDALQRQRERIRELEAQLGLAQAQTRNLESELEGLRADERVRATRIGPECPVAHEEETADIAVIEEAPPPDEANRPVLRLYGSGGEGLPPAASITGVRALPGPNAPAMVAAPPLASVRLPVGAGAGLDPSAGVPAIPASPIAVAGDPMSDAVALPAVVDVPRGAQPQLDDAAVQEYRAALRHLSANELDDALAGFARFIAQHPHHPYADNALFWRGEVQYAQREFSGALRSFSDLLRRYPQGNKVPDALLRIGHCYEQMGDRTRARRVFDRLRAQYPESVAARMASREDA